MVMRSGMSLNGYTLGTSSKIKLDTGKEKQENPGFKKSEKIGAKYILFLLIV